MKSVVLFALIAVVCTAFATRCENECVPGTHFREDCNDCSCNEDGQKVCTLKLCPPPTKPCPKGKKKVCVPNSNFKQDCNTCTCNECGTAAICNTIACPKPVCVPNSTFKQECNTCNCNIYGTAASCTKIACNVGTPQ